MPCNILKVLSSPIALSTCILALAMRLVFVVAKLLSRLPLVNGGILSVAPLSASAPLIRKPLSAITSSPYSILSRKPDSSTIFLSEADPVQSLDRKENEPDGVIDTSSFTVLWCLYELQVTRWLEGKLGLWIKNSVQSITALVLEKHLKTFGNLWRTCSLDGQWTKNLSSWYRKHIHVMVIRLTLELETENMSDNTSTSSPLLTLASVIMNSSNADSTRGGPLFCK